MIDAEEAASAGSGERSDPAPASHFGVESAGPSFDAKEAAAGWVAEHGDVLWRFALARTRSRHVAEEIVQETVLAAMKAGGTFRGDSSVRSWLLGIAAHKIADHFRQARRSSPQPKDPGQGSSGGAKSDDLSVDAQFSARGYWSSGPADWGSRPDDPTERAELLRAMRKCLEDLPPVMAEAVWMRDILNVPSAEVCQALGLTATNLWTRTHRARAALRLCVERAIGMGGKGEGCEP